MKNSETPYWDKQIQTLIEASLVSMIGFTERDKKERDWGGLRKPGKNPATECSRATKKKVENVCQKREEVF